VKASFPLYPGYVRRPRAHVLALDDGACLILPSTGEILQPTSYAEWLTFALDNKLDVRVDSIIGWRFFDDVLKDEHAHILAARSRLDLHPKAVSIRWRVGNQYCTLFPASQWGDSATLESLKTHQATLDYLNVGVYASPSSLGQATMARAMVDQTGKLKGYNVPNRNCAKDLRDNLVGGRIETYQPGVYPDITEIDRNSAYVDEAAGFLPCGKAIDLYAPGLTEANEYAHYYAQCVVFIHINLSLGPFPFRDATTGNVSYPTEPGTYENVWLWKGEIQDSIQAGCQVVIRKAWAWSKSEPALRSWAEWMYDKRGPDAPNEHVRSYIKRLALAAIGWHGMAPAHLRVVPWSEDNEDTTPIVNQNGFPTGFVAVAELEKQPRQLTHWASYIYAQARRTLYRRELDEIESGNRLVTCDTDSLKLAYPTKLATSQTMLGAWKSRTLTNVRQSIGRGYYCDQKMVAPGVSGEDSRERWTRTLHLWLEERQEKDALDALQKANHPAEWALDRLRDLKDWEPAMGWAPPVRKKRGED